MKKFRMWIQENMPELDYWMLLVTESWEIYKPIYLALLLAAISTVLTLKFSQTIG